MDSNVLLDVATQDARWFNWSSQALTRATAAGVPTINPLIYAEVSIGYESTVELEAALPSHAFRRDPLPYGAAFIAGKCFLVYRRRGGRRASPLPDFYIGAHAQVAGLRLLARDVSRYTTYFPEVELIAPP